MRPMAMKEMEMMRVMRERAEVGDQWRKSGRPGVEDRVEEGGAGGEPGEEQPIS